MVHEGAEVMEAVGRVARAAALGAGRVGEARGAGRAAPGFWRWVPRF